MTLEKVFDITIKTAHNSDSNTKNGDHSQSVYRRP